MTDKPLEQMMADEKTKKPRLLAFLSPLMAATFAMRGLEKMGELPPSEGFVEDDMPVPFHNVAGLKRRVVQFAPEEERPKFCRRCGGNTTLSRKDRDACRCTTPKGAP